MPTITVTLPPEMEQKLRLKAGVAGVTLETYLRQLAEKDAANGTPTLAPQVSLTGNAWKQEFDSFTREVEAMAHRLPPGHSIDDDRESIYREREDAQR